jgi:hypothetical protein
MRNESSRARTYLTYVTLGRRRKRNRGGAAGGKERETLVLAGEAVGGVDVAVAAIAQGGLVGAAEHASLCRLAGAAQHLHVSTTSVAAVSSARGRLIDRQTEWSYGGTARGDQWLWCGRGRHGVAVRYYGGAAWKGME